jgi:hypothetical protein
VNSWLRVLKQRHCYVDVACALREPGEPDPHAIGGGLRRDCRRDDLRPLGVLGDRVPVRSALAVHSLIDNVLIGEARNMFDSARGGHDALTGSNNSGSGFVNNEKDGLKSSPNFGKMVKELRSYRAKYSGRTVKALTRLETLRISKDQFLKLLREFPEIAVEIMRVLALRLAKTNRQLLDARDQLRSLGG